jgi:hypothetical protein
MDVEMNLATGVKSGEPMDETEIQAIVAAELVDATNFIDLEISNLRARATEYYFGDPFGDEEEGRSQVVSMDVRDTVQAILPSLMRIFFSSENVVQYVPRSMEDAPMAEQATDYVRYILNEDNNGFVLFHSIFKDALVRKTGVCKWWVDEHIEVKNENYTGLDDTQLSLILGQEGVEMVDLMSTEDPSAPPPVIDPLTGQQLTPTIMIHDVTVSRKIITKRFRVESLAPEEFIVDRRARTLEDADIVAHRKLATVSELVAMGYDQELVESNTGEDELDTNIERIARNPAQMMFGESANNPAQRRVLYTESYIRMDMDGDGVAELRKICTMGPSYKIVANDPADDVPFAYFCPDPEPHTLFGMSTADVTMDIQRIKSVILRNMLDSLAQSIHPRTGVVEGQVNLDDVLNNENGAIIRMRAPGMVQPFTTPFVGGQAFPMMEYMDQVKEARTGMSKASMGLNADALQSTTKLAVQATVQAAQQHIELIARVFSEIGMKRLFKGLLRLITRHQDKPRVIRLRNQWVQIDPRGWDASMDVSVNVGLGTGGIDEKIQFLQAIAGKQEQLLQTLGTNNPIVTVGQYANTLSKLVEMAGYKDSTQFFNQFPMDFSPPPAQPQPDPTQALAQVQIQSIQADIQKKAAELALEREKMIRADDRERDRIAQDGILKRQEMELKYQVDLAATQAEIDARVAMDRERLQMQAINQAQQAVTAAQPMQ